MPNNPIPYWRTGGFEPQALISGRHDLSREEVLASQRGRIMRGALYELGSRGANPMTVASVVAHAKVSKKTFYETFDGLDECVREAVQTLNVVAGGEMARAAREADPSQLFGRLHAVSLELLESARDEPILTTGLLAPGFGLETPGAGEWALYGEIRSKMLIAWYDDERNRTADLPETTLPRAMAAFAAFEYSILRSLAAGKQDELPAQVEDIVNLIVGILSNGGVEYRLLAQEGHH